MAWPAFFNGFPLIYPDSLWYIRAGRPVAAALLRNHRSFSYNNRSLVYSLGILPFHLDRTVWPVIALQCLMTTWLVWLVVRSISPKRKWLFFAILIVLLSLFSSMSWFGSLVMPDILGPDLDLSMFLLVFAPDTISRVERIALWVIAWWAIASHGTHLLIVVALGCALTILAISRRMPFRRYLTLAAQPAIIVALAVVTLIGLNTFLYDRPILQGERPPFLTARLIADGPGRQYLQEHCATSNWEVCRYTKNLAGSSDRFLWSPDGVWATANESSRRLIRSQDGQLAFAVWRAYPLEELLRSAANFSWQLQTFDLRSCVPTSEVNLQMHRATPELEGKYFQSLQAHNKLPLRTFNEIDHAAVLFSFVGIAMRFRWLLRRRPQRLIALGFVIAASLLANALVTGTLSTVDGRFGARIVWLVPLFALLCVLQKAPGDTAQSLPEVLSTPATKDTSPIAG